jgi:multiple sugar transport system substrate-binding protein
MMIQMLCQLGADYSTKSGEIKIFNEETKDLLKTIAKQGKGKALYTFNTVGYPGNFLNVGQSIFGIDSTAGATWMGTDRPLNDSHSAQEKYEYELAVMPLPQFDTENPKMISQGPSICIFNKEDSQEVLASWLFTQFLLTNEVQIAYAQTEGYVPVTLKAQQSDAYQDYLSRKGENNDLYYAPKIEASQILLNNLENTFVTPVFNGSTSLRNAAGQLIEDIRKHARQGKKMDDAYFEELYKETSSLYRLDQIQRTGNGAVGAMYLGEMPTASVVLLVTLAVCWVGIGVLFIWNCKKTKNSKKRLISTP